MRVHALQTGTLSVKKSYYAARGRIRLLRLASVLLDSAFMDIPVFTWAIEHPEGIIVIDTGLTAQVHQPGYFPLWQRPYWKTQYRYHITQQEEIGPQLQALGISPADVRWVVLTHAHFDHTSALYHFPGAEIIFARKEYEDVQRLRSAHFAFPAKWPTWLKPRLIDYLPQPVGPFQHSFPLTQAGDVRLIPTPGHTMHHQSVILEDDEETLFFAGDTSFDQPSLLNGTLDAPSFNAQQVLETRRRILELATQRPLVYLATHDEDTGYRLNQRITVAGPQRVRQ